MKQKSFWSACEMIIGPAAVELEWKQLSGDAVQIAYLEARSATQNFVDRHSIYGVRQLINQIQAGKSLDTAMQQKLSVSYEQFQSQWAKTHRSSMKSSGS